MHTFYWGDWYDKIIGPELAAQISPMRYAIDKGMMPTGHTDAPVALPNLMQVMWATVNRVTRSGKVQGPAERVTPIEGLKAITHWGARQHFEEQTKGSVLKPFASHPVPSGRHSLYYWACVVPQTAPNKSFAF